MYAAVLGLEGLWVSLKDGLDGSLPLLFIVLGILAILTLAGIAIKTCAEALAVQLQTLAVFAVARLAF